MLLALGFSGPDQEDGLLGQLGVELEPRGTIARDAEFATNVPGVFAAGDAARLPAPISPYDRPMTV